MFQNLKVDVIYYNTNTDFEMEFNLCGCCRMRLLTDKVSERKVFLHSLSRAVSRSKVIIITGNLFNENGIINMAAAAIGSSLETADNKSYAIDSDQEIKIVKGSVPLVTAEGYFGGCIIENGPQTMILVSDSRNIRKSIMKTLIHPYIEELCAAELTKKAAASHGEEPVIIEEAPILPTSIPVAEAALPTIPETEVEEEKEVLEDEKIEQEEIIDEKTVEETEVPVNEATETQEAEPEEETEEIAVEGGMSYETEDDLIFPDDVETEEDDEDLFVKPLYIKKRHAKEINSSYFEYDQEDEVDIDFDEEEFEEPKPKRSLALNTPILILSIFLLVLIALISFCIFYVSEQYGSNAQESIREIYSTFFAKV